MITKKIIIQQEEIELKMYNADNNDNLILFLHGAGQSNQEIFTDICLFLQNKHINCVSFDFSGHGKSTNNIISSINKKTEEAKFIYEIFRKNYKNIHIFAFSMSGQIAINLIKIYPEIKTITLFAPALYDKNSFDVNFGEEFTKMIRVNESWKNTNAYEVLANYSGFINLVTAEYDDVIPNDVLDIYRNFSKKENFQEIFLKNSPHAIGKWLQKNPSEFNLIFEKISKNF